VPVSSDTTITAASVSSESPSAARWRVPSSFGSPGFCDSGRKQPACVRRLPWNQHRAVVHRRRRQEDREEQLARDPGIEADTAVDVRPQVGLALQRDQGADAAGRQQVRAAHALLQHPLLLDRVEETQERRLPHVREGPAQFGLEKDDDDEHHGAEQVLQHPVHRVQPDPAGGEIEAQQQPEPDEHLDRAGPRSSRIRL